MIPCPVCGESRLTYWARGGDEEYRSVIDVFEFQRCDECGAISIDQVPSDRLSEIYPPNYYSYGSSSGSLVWRVKDMLDRRSLRQISRRIPGEQLSVLDVGGGAGAVLTAMRRADPRVARTTVIDIDPAARAAAEVAGHRYIHTRIENFEPADAFDLILMINLIEHVANPVAVLSAARRMLTPQGLIVVKTPNVSSLDARLFRTGYWGGLHAPRHWVLFDRLSFGRAVSSAGLTIARFGYTQGGAFWAYSILAGARRRGLVTITAERPMVYHPLFKALAAGFALFDFLRLPFAKPSQMVAVLANRAQPSDRRGQRAMSR